MSEVILVVPGCPERRDEVVAAARRLGELIGNGRVVELAPPDSLGAAGAHYVADAAAPGRKDPATEMAARGSRVDFIVTTQPGPEDDRATRAVFRAALFRTERPVLMVPAGGHAASFGRHVAIAWRDDARILKALIPALRLLSGAQEVHLFAGVRAGAPTPVAPPVLVEHGVQAILHVLAIGSAPFGELLLDRVRELGLDLLIMGAQAHGAWREMLLGGVTSYVVSHADLPVLLRH
jgi:nucleotide-binding universal stress UspA family protein